MEFCPYEAYLLNYARFYDLLTIDTVFVKFDHILDILLNFHNILYFWNFDFTNGYSCESSRSGYLGGGVVGCPV